MVRIKRAIALVVSAVMLLTSMTAYAADDAQNVQGENKKTYTLSVSKDTGCSVTVSGEGVTLIEEGQYTVDAGTSVSVQITVEDGYSFAGLSINGSDVNVQDNKAVFEMPEMDSTLKVQISEIEQIVNNEDENDEEKEKVEDPVLEEGDKETTDEKKSEPAPDNSIPEKQTESEEPTSEDLKALVARYHSIAIAGAGVSAAARATEYLSTGQTLYYYGSKTHRFSVNGQEAYCIEPIVDSPGSGNYQVINSYTIDVEGNGKNPIDYLRAALWYSYGSPGFDPDMWPATYYDGSSMDADDYRICSHLLVSKAFQNSTSALRVGCTRDFYLWFKNNITGDKYTDSNIDSNNPWNQIVYQNKYQDVPDDFNVYFLYTGDDTQLIAYWDYNPTGFVKLLKSSANPDITDNNSCYSLSGAVYGVYSDSGCTDRVATLTTDAAGTSNTVEIDNGKYYVKEITAPKGYALDTKVYSVTVTGNNTTTLKVSDIPQSDPVRVVLGKIDAETTKDLPQGSASLEGAEFTVKYYDDKCALDSEKAIRTWVIKTNANGKSALTESLKVSGDDFYYMSTGDVTIPLGYITIQETKAPEGYLLNDEVFVRQITSDGTAESVNTYNQPTVPEDVIRGDLILVKYAENNAESDDSYEDIKRPLAGVKFHLKSNTTGETFTIITDEQGIASTTQLGLSDRGNLVYDTYTVTEESPYPEYDEVKPFEVTISEEGKTLYYILRNDTVDAPIQVQKTDATTGKVIPLAGAQFQILDNEKNVISMVVSQYPSMIVQDTWTTDDTGMFVLPEKLEYGVYYLRELNAPEGYLLGENDIRFEVTDEYQWDEPLVVSYADQPAMGQIGIIKTDAFEGYPLAGAEFTVTAAEDIMTPDGTLRAAAGEVVDKITTGYDGTVQSKKLFLGKYTVTESMQPTGYVLPDQSWEIELTYKDQYTAVVTESIDAENQPTVLQIDKKVTGSDQRLAGVKFVIWNKDKEDPVDPGMTYKDIYTTDDKGQIRIERIEPGTYCVKEVEAVPGYAINDDIYEFTVTDDGRIKGEPDFVLTVENAKTEITETNVVNVQSGIQKVYPDVITAVDTVSMANLQPFETYTLKGELIDVVTRQPVKDASGNALLVEQMFTATQSKMDVDVTFRDVDLSAYAGRTIVVFEHLYIGDTEISAHEDINDHNQQLHILKPELHTTAIDLETGSHQGIAKDNVTIRDNVEFKNIIPGTYKLKGILMDQGTGKPLLINDNQVVAEKIVHISNESGMLSIDFTFNASKLNGSTVVYEYLYPVNPDTGNPGDDPVASHEDITDKDQTVTYKLGSLTAFLPGHSGSGWLTPRTGDSTNVYIIIAIMCMAACAAGSAYIVIKKRKADNGDEE